MPRHCFDDGLNPRHDMFRTHNDEMVGLPGMLGEGLAHWHAVSRSLASHWYHVSIRQRYEDRFISQVEMLNDETRLFELISSQGEDLLISDLQAVTPPWMNRSEGWRWKSSRRFPLALTKTRSLCACWRLRAASCTPTPTILPSMPMP